MDYGRSDIFGMKEENRIVDPNYKNTELEYLIENRASIKEIVRHLVGLVVYYDQKASSKQRVADPNALSNQEEGLIVYCFRDGIEFLKGKRINNKSYFCIYTDISKIPECPEKTAIYRIDAEIAEKILKYVDCDDRDERREDHFNADGIIINPGIDDIIIEKDIIKKYRKKLLFF